MSELREALKLAQRMCREALPKFNWGASSLDANAIDLLNRAPLAIDAALSAEPAQEMTDETKAYAEGRGDQFEDDCAIVRDLFDELNDVDVMKDGFINTTRVREMLAHFDVAAPSSATSASRLPEMGEGDWPELQQAVWLDGVGYTPSELHAARVAAVEKYKALVRGKA